MNGISSAETYIQLKKENTKNLVRILRPHIYSGFQIMYGKAKEFNPAKPIVTFQITLSKIGMLPQKVLLDDYRTLLRTVDEAFLTELIRSIYTLSAKIQLLSTGLSSDIATTTNVKVVSNISFIHKCYLASARAIYPVANYFSEKYPIETRQRNTDALYQKIEESIELVVAEIRPLSKNVLLTEPSPLPLVPNEAFQPQPQVGQQTLLPQPRQLLNIPVDTSFLSQYEKNKTNVDTNIENFIGTHSQIREPTNQPFKEVPAEIEVHSSPSKSSANKTSSILSISETKSAHTHSHHHSHSHHEHDHNRHHDNNDNSILKVRVADNENSPQTEKIHNDEESKVIVKFDSKSSHHHHRRRSRSSSTTTSTSSSERHSKSSSISDGETSYKWTKFSDEPPQSGNGKKQSQKKKNSVENQIKKLERILK